jgi:N,N'-diacetyllegionaminate synthase
MIDSHKTFIIAEIGVNHNGHVDLAVKMVQAAARCGVDAVKFQTFVADRLVVPGTPKADYQKNNTNESDQYEMLKRLELPEAAYGAILEACRNSGVEFMSTPFDDLSADFLVGLGMSKIKIPSGEITNYPFLKHLAGKRLPLILSTGMASLEEVVSAVQVIKEALEQQGLSVKDYLTLLHCTSNYPASPASANLLCMDTLRETFNVAVGYSDHTEGILVPITAVACKATVIEKHFTLDKTLPGPDQKASSDPKEFAQMVAVIRQIEQILGDGEKVPTMEEIPNKSVVRRSIVMARTIKAGEILQAVDLVLLRPGTGLNPKELSNVVGRRVKADLAQGCVLSWDHLL